MTDLAIPARVDALARLRSEVTGQVLVAGDPGWDDARSAWNCAYVHDPQVVVVAASAADVQAAVRFAAATQMGLGVQATGHGVTRTADGGLLLLTRQLDEVRIDAEARTAWVGAGCTWQPVLEAAQLVGLAPLVGSTPHVGAVGYTLGGGLGWLARRHGASADKARRFEVVTPDGRLVTASATEHPELFRALRGGGGGALGIVTGMEVELVPVTTVYGGNLLYPVSQAREVIRAYRRWIQDAPEELSSAINLMNFPPFPELPEPIRGKSFAIVRGCWDGDLAEGAAFVDRLRAELPPALDMWGEMPFSEVATISADPVDPLPAALTGGWLHDLDEHVAEVLVDMIFAADGPPPLLFGEVRHIGGAVARGDRATTSLGHRDSQFLFSTIGLTAGPEMAAATVAHQARLRERLATAFTGGTYLNFVEGEERRAGTATAFDPGVREELSELKAALDPDDVLRFGVEL